MTDNNGINGMVNSSSLNEVGICALCGKKSDCKCDRCGDFYCSVNCQKKDWQKHRFICFPMPNLVKVGLCSSPTNNICKDSPPDSSVKDANRMKLPNGSCVFLTAFKCLNRCSIRSTNPSVIAEYDKILNEINEYGQNSSPLSTKPKPNSFALALRNNKWCRVKILGCNNGNIYSVDFVDIGATSNKSYKELRRITPSLESLPFLIQNIHLKDVISSSSKKLLDYIVKYTNKEYKLEYVRADRFGGNVALLLWGTSTSLNSLLKELAKNHKKTHNDSDNVSICSLSKEDVDNVTDKECNDIKQAADKNNIQTNVNENIDKNCDNNHETAVENGVLPAKTSEKAISKSGPRQIQVQKPCLEPPFEIIPINENDQNCNIMIMDNSYIDSGFIGCLLQKYCENLKEISKFLSEYNATDQSYRPRLNEYCLANFEDEWYRAKVVEILSEDKFFVVYIDFTNEKELSSKSIRRYPMSLTFPCYTSLCAIDDLPEDKSDELKKFLDSKCIPFKTLNVDSVRIVDDIRYIKSTDLLNQLRDAKLL